MDNVTVIIPVIGTAESDVELFTKAYNSAKPQAKNIIVVGPEEAVKPIREILHNLEAGTEIIANEGDTSYPSQVMLALQSVKTDFFSVLEYDDVFTENWLANVEKYNDDEVIGYLPLTEVNDADKNEVVGYANEAFWASSFSEEIGYPDFESMSDYLNFNMSGAVLKKKEFLTLGGLKTSMKLVFWYEFLLRALYKKKKFYVVPKIGYIHTSIRKGSLTDIYRETMSEKEVDWWLELAKKEYFFPQDRHKEYEEE